MELTGRAMLYSRTDGASGAVIEVQLVVRLHQIYG